MDAGRGFGPAPTAGDGNREWGRSMNTIKFALMALVTILAGATDAAAAVEALASRPGVVQPIYLTQESKPVASVVLLPGGRGKVGLDATKGITRGKIK